MKSDNLNASYPINSDELDRDIEVAQPDDYIHAATSDHTRRAYRSDIAHYQKQGGVLPAQPEHIEHYLKLSAKTLNPRTLKRRLSAIRLI